jgi:hypothetical protein
MTASKKYKKIQEDIPIIAEEETVYHARIDGKLLESRYKPKLIDLFAGAGGMTLGFTKLTGHSFQPGKESGAKESGATKKVQRKWGQASKLSS